MAAAPTPAKLKACLAQVKERSLPDNDESLTVTSEYFALLATELVQRGVLVQINKLEDVPQIFDLVRSTAGRSLLDTASSNIPKPLLAACAAVSGMVAEKCCSLLEQTQETLQFDKDEFELYKSVLARCREVGDKRLEALLQLPFASQKMDDNNDKDSKKKEQQFLFLQIAEGQYLRAASFQPEPPQMWKRALDVIIQRQSLFLDDYTSDPLEAALPLQNLIRVAQQKGNEKRASELSLRLAESLLCREPSHSTFSSEAKEIYDVFCAPYVPKQSEDMTERAEQAREALNKCNLELLPEEAGIASVRFQTAALIVETALEDAAIQELATEKHTASKNRSQGGGLSSSIASMESCKKLARNQVLRRVLESNKRADPIDEKAVLLRDVVLPMISSAAATLESPQLTVAMNLLRQQVQRLQDRARSIALAAAQAKKPTCNQADVQWAWSTVSSFVNPILSSVKEQCGEQQSNDKSVEEFLLSLPLSGRQMVTTCAMACVSTCWMTATTTAVDPNMMDVVMCMLSSSLDSTNKERERTTTSGTSVVKTDTKDLSLFQLECARVSSMCLLQMSTNNSELLPTISEEAIHMASGKMTDRYDQAQDEFGTFYLQFIVCWSGLFQSAWPYCNVTQVRAIAQKAQQGFKSAMTNWGRVAQPIETMLLHLGHADVEGGLLVGGFVRQAGSLFKQVLAQIQQYQQSNDDEQHHLNTTCLTLLKTHCLNGMARIALQGDTHTSMMDEGTKSGSKLAQVLGQDALHDLDQLRPSVDESSSGVYLWSESGASHASLVFHVSVARQLVADALVRASRPSDAQSFLEDAVRDAPMDFDAALALGAFRLLMTLYSCQEGSPPPTAADEKMAQTQLLKAAKLDTTKADPFALLGLWYEKRGDSKRAIGCYSKALLLEPPHPVAGRGILRLKPFEDVKNLCDAASNTNSPMNGWAWRALGQDKAMIAGNDELAIVCYQKALRCRDIESPANESLGVFYLPPPQTFEPQSINRDSCSTWAELAGCYRRLGRYSAAVRAYESANDAVPDGLSSPYMCMWAQVELELGLQEEAAEKFATVLSRDEVSSHPPAAYGQGSALLAMAHRDLQDGKGGHAHELLKRAIDGLQRSLVKKDGDSFSSAFICALKLLGDLYSAAAWLPPDVFLSNSVDDESEDSSPQHMVRLQISFVALGENAYRAALEAREEGGDSEFEALEASFICDIGTNKLLQAQLLAALNGEGGEGIEDSSITKVIEKVPEVRDAFDSAAKTFQNAIETDPLYPSAWCGLGCAVCGVDPLLSQHAFCRALQLDKTFPDVWANLGFLYATHGSMVASAAMMDSLTQVADTPMMWIGRALLLERMAFSPEDLINEVAGAETSPEALISQAADAYRASLQVVKHPSALLGLSLTCRMTPKSAAQLKGECAEVSRLQARVESSACMSEYLHATGGVNTTASALGSAMTMEDWVDSNIKTGVPWDRDSRATEESTESQIDKGIDNGSKMDMLQSLSKTSTGNSSEVESTEREEKKESTFQFGHDLSISRQIVHDPDNGKLWLQLAKNLATELVSVANSGSPKRKIVRTTLESAVLAANRAEKFLTDQFSKPIQLKPTRHVHYDGNQEELSPLSQSSVPRIVDARDVSDALSLAYWVTKAGSEISEDVVLSKERSYDTQKALIMCPSNALAREAFGTVDNIDDDASGDKEGL